MVVSVTVVIAGSGQVCGLVKRISGPCLGGRWFPADGAAWVAA